MALGVWLHRVRQTSLESLTRSAGAGLLCWVVPAPAATGITPPGRRTKIGKSNSRRDKNKSLPEFLLLFGQDLRCVKKS